MKELFTILHFFRRVKHHHNHQYELSEKYQTSVPTVRRDLMKLIDAGLVKPSMKDGHRQLYVYSGTH